MYKMFGLAGKGVASPPTQFSLKTVDEVLAKYNVNGNWYDYSCGWGVRLMGVKNRSFGTVNGDGQNHQHNGDESIYVFRKAAL